MIGRICRPHQSHRPESLNGPVDHGKCFVDMHKFYDFNLAGLVLKTGLKNNLRVAKGVFAGILNPSLETPAEARYLQTIGAVGDGIIAVANKAAVGFDIITNQLAAKT